MPVIQPKKEVGNLGVGTNRVPRGESPRPSAWTRFTAVCSTIAKSFLSDSDRACSQFPCGDPVAGTDSDKACEQVKRFDDYKVANRAKKTSLLRKAGPEFKAGMLAFHKHLQRTLPIIVEKNEYLKTPLSGSVGSDVDTDSNFESTGSYASTSQGEQSLAEEFAEMGDFDFAAASNPFRQFEGHGNESQASASTLSVGKQQAGGSQRIVDYVPSNFPTTRQQMLVNFRVKIIAENFKATGLLKIHNEAALSKLLKTLGQAVSDKSVVALDALTPSQAHSLFESFCQKLKISPFRKGYEQI